MIEEVYETCVFGRQHHRPASGEKHGHTHHHDHDGHDHGHDHDHSHDHRKTDKKVLLISLVITLIAMGVEIAAGIIAHSLALLSDAVHMLSHAFALGLSYVASVLAARPAPAEKSFGYYRLEVLAALTNGMTILLSVAWILYEAVERFLNPEAVDAMTTIWVAVFGLVVNIATGVILMQGDRENMNLKSAFMHMLADALSSVVVVAGGIAIYYTGWYPIDTLLALLVAFLIARWSLHLVRDAIHILLEGSPLELDEVKKRIEEKFDQVVEVHDLHIWEITHRMRFLTAHLVLEKGDLDDYPDLVDRINRELEHEYDIVHTTFQPEWRKATPPGSGTTPPA